MPVAGIGRWTSGLLVPQKRRIGGIPAQVTISEQERDELQITEHPVEQGAPISDHAFKRPSEVHIRAGWSGTVGDVGAISNRGWYAMLLQLQAALEPFDLYTGKRKYSDMLIQSLTVTTDSHSEYALMAEIVCRQVIIVSIKTAKAQTYSNNPNDQKSPEQTASSSDKGSQQPREVGNDNPGYDEAGSDPRDPMETHVQSGGEEAGSDQRSPLQSHVDSGGEEAGSSPEAGKVADTTAKNDPTGELAKDKGLGLGSEKSTPLAGPGLIPMMAPTRTRLTMPRPMTMIRPLSMRQLLAQRVANNGNIF